MHQTYEGKCKRLRLKVMEAILGEEGILNAEDSYQFEQRSAAASTLMVPLSNEFLQYFNKTLKPKLLINFSNMGTEGLNSANRWTNNNAELKHKIMKIDTNRKPKSTSSLINILEDMIKLQFLDLQSTLQQGKLHSSWNLQTPLHKGRLISHQNCR